MKIVNFFPRAIEKRYALALSRIFMQWLTDLIRDLKGELPGVIKEAHRYDEARNDLDFAHLIRVVIEKHKMGFSIFAKMAESQAGTTFNSVDKWTKRQQQRVEKAIGIDLRKTELYKSGVASTFVHQNVGLITKLSGEMAGKLESIIYSGIQTGKLTRDIAADIRAVSDIGRYRSLLIARDQVAKLNSQLTRVRQTKAGVEKYTWETADDERVCDVCDNRDGEVYSWSKPPFPGTIHVGCRCGSSAVLDDLLQEAA